MKAMVICGSSVQGFTSEMCEYFSNGLSTQGVECEIVFPIELDIGHCTGCDECSKTGECIIRDHMGDVYDKFRRSNLLILATPIHFSGPSSVIKTVIDRFQPLWFKGGEHPAYIAALLNGGGQSPNFNNTLSIFKAFSITAGMKWLGCLEISDTDNMRSRDVRELSFEYGKEIGRIVTEDRK